MRPWTLLAFLTLMCLLNVPATYAQGTLSGVIKDTSGAVLPGVTVEAASPVLIEKVRTTVTDGTGQYRIVDLRGGTYTVTFTLPAFATVRREGVQLTGENIVTMNAEMRVGAVSETITVTGETPTVDSKSTTRQQVMTRDIINSLPTGRNYAAFGLLVAGVNTSAQNSGGAIGDPMAQLTIHGSRPGDQRVMQNGVNTMTLQVNGDRGIAVPNPSMASEVTVDTSGLSAEQGQGGVRINYIPRDGGNTFTNSTFVTFANSRMQSNNLTADLVARGLPSPNSIKLNYDVNPGFGGPIRKDRMWFYFTGRVNRADNFAAGSYVNANAFKLTNPQKFTVVDDVTQPGYARNLWTDWQLRLTMQAAPKNKIAFTWDQQTRCSCPAGVPTPAAGTISATVSPEASVNFRSPTQRLIHFEWSSPVTNRLLLEAAGVHRTERWGAMPPNTQWSSDFITPAQQAVLESGAMIPVLDTATGHFSQGNFVGYNSNWVPNFYFRASASYVTGGHQIKAGFSDSVGYLESTVYDYSPYNVFLISPPGVPVFLINEKVTPLFARSDQPYDLGIFVQDRWTMDKLTLNLGLRYDAFKATAPPQVVVGKTTLTPNRADIAFPETEMAHWQDITPRFGLTYDATGDGKTAVKISLNKYVEGQSVGSLVGVNAGGAGPHPVSTLNNSTSRVWIDANGDGHPQCDLTAVAANGECLAMTNPGFGSPIANAATFDPDRYFGWGSRGYSWEFGAGVQREILPRVSVDAGYFRRWYGNFAVIDNTALTAADFGSFKLMTPTAAGLSTSGNALTVYDATTVVAPQNRTTLASKYGSQFEHWNGVEVSVNARLSKGLLFFGGVDTGRTMVDNCDVVKNLPEARTVAAFGGAVSRPAEYCHIESPFLTQVKLNGTYTIRKADVLLSATFQSTPGISIQANYPITRGAPGVGLVASPNATVALLPSVAGVGTDYGDRLNQVDLRVGKVLRFRKTRTVVNFDVFNLFNGNAVTGENPVLNPATLVLRTPTQILLARFVKIGAQFDF